MLRRGLLVLVALAWWLSPCGASAHVVSEVTRLGFNGYIGPFGADGAEQYTDVWAEGNYAYLGSVGSGVAVLNLDTGAHDSGVLKNPELVATYAPAGHLDYQDVKVSGGVGYFSGAGGTDLVDLSNPMAPTPLSQITSANGGHTASRNVAVGGGYLYQVSTSSPEVRVFSLADLSAPALVRTITTPDTVGLNDVTLVNSRLYVAGAGGGSYLYDVSSVGAATPPLDLTAPTGAATASVWPTDDGQRILVTHLEPGGELAVWDTASVPTLIDSKSAGDLGFNSYSTAEVVVDGSLAYVAWHQGGLEVIDLDQVGSVGLQRAAYYLIPGDNVQNGFTGVRSVYPFLGADQVLFSDTKRGLYRVDASEISTGLPGDYDGDSRVGLFDLQVWRLQYGSSLLAADGNGDGIVDAADYTVWRDAYAQASGAPAAAPAPEPNAAALVAAFFALLCLFNRNLTPTI